MKKKIEKKYFIIIDNEDCVWHKKSGEWDIINIEYITKSNFLSLKQAKKWKKELDNTVGKKNKIIFNVKEIMIYIL